MAAAASSSSSSTTPRSQADAPSADVHVVSGPFHPGSTTPPRETIDLGGMRIDVLEDGVHTDRRLGAIYITLAPRSPGMCEHWHQMHDETLLVIRGTLSFTSRSGTVSAKAGDYIIIPPSAPHAFANGSADEECVLFATFTPAFYVNYFRLLKRMVEQQRGAGAGSGSGSGAGAGADARGAITEQMGREAMQRFATVSIQPWGEVLGGIFRESDG